tara:strand:+ start:1631 stop:2050 length:420 start_codon:yes stop_codon:yes gene_type:complete
MLKSLIKFLTFFSLYQSNEAFNFNQIIPLKLDKIVSPIQSQQDNHLCPEYLEKWTKFLNDDQGEFLIKKISGLFPKMDIISHYVLHTNDVLINVILNSDKLDVEQKRKFAIMLVEFTQNGDATGRQILSIYHDLINCLL